ncbi:hypothetical protein KP509_1Z005600 [Ceratopteris richardii]|nr:hypothetical protein KP509_1Z005600 [Ceratopteris richardii]
MKAAGKRLTVNLQAVLFRDVQQCFLFSTNTAEIAEDYPRQKSKAKRRSNLLTLLRKPNQKLARELTQSPQLSVKTLPLLSSCLPLSAFSPEDFAWMKDNLLSIKRCLLYAPSVMEAMDSTEPEDPLHHHESLLYLAFQHKGTCRHEQARHIRLGHSRLSFLGQYIVELALVEYFLMRYPRDVTACIRERIFGLTRRSMLPRWIESAGLHDVVFASNNNVKEFDGRTKLKIVRDFFWAMLGASFLSMGVQEVYRILFEVFNMDPDAEYCQPSPRLRYEDNDRVHPEFEKEQLCWKDILAHSASESSSLYAKPMLFKACVPPGVTRFRGNMWDINSLPILLQVLQYPLQFEDDNTELAMSRNAGLELGLQLCFCDHLAYKLEHPRFCNERLLYLGQKIQDLVMAERLVTKHLDGPGAWLQDIHRRLLFNRVCGKYFREFKLHSHIIYRDPSEEPIFRGKNSEKIASTNVAQALHGLGYVVYGKSEVSRLMKTIFKYERPKKKRG